MTQVKTPYFLLCDDDFVFDASTDLSLPQKVMDHDLSIGIVGGKLFDVYEGQEFKPRNPRSWEKLLFLDRESRSLSLVSVWSTVPSPNFAGNIEYYLTDTALNWALMRTHLFHNGTLGWDSQFKIEGEHEDFYLHRKLNASHVKVAYCPSLVAYHNHSSKHYGDNYSHLRTRLEGWKQFSIKWQVDLVIDIDAAMGRLIFTNAAQIRNIPSTKDKKVNATFDPFERFDRSRNAIEFDDTGKIYAINRDGEASTNGIGSLLLSPESGKLMIGVPQTAAKQGTPIAIAGLSEGWSHQRVNERARQRATHIVKFLATIRHPLSRTQRRAFRDRWTIVS